jgi:hypothetical protein
LFFLFPLQRSFLDFSSPLLRALSFLISLLIYAARYRRRITGSCNVRHSASFSPS